MLPTTNEWIAFAVVTILAGALAGGLVWMGGRSQEIPPRQLRRTVGLLWLSIIMCVAGLVAVRQLLGGGIVDYDSRGASPVTVRTLGASEGLLVGGGVAWMILWMLVALHAIRSVTSRIGEPTSDPSDSSQT